MTVKGIGDILNKLQKAKMLGNGEYQACCPAHEDKRQSLSLKQDGDKILINCFAGCQPDMIMSKIGLSLSDLYIKTEPAPVREPPPQITKTYSYPDEDGKELFQVVRMFPKSFRQRHMNGGGEWCWSMEGVRRVLYHLPEVLAAAGAVYLVEGEKDADNLCAAGFIATTSPAGANNWRPEYAQTAIESLKGSAASISVILLPGEDVKDVSDWLEKGNDPQLLPSMTQSPDCLIPLVETETVNTNNDRSKPLTDLGNAERLVAQFGDVLRYSYERKLWLTWQGDCWGWDENGETMKFAHKVARSIYVEASKETDDDKCKEIVRWARQSESNMRLSAMLAQAQPLLSVKIKELDGNEWLLNCANGTVNLKTGQLQPHNSKDLITRVISTKFDPAATSEEWQKFLNRIFDNKPELIAFIKRAMGYSISGNQGEQAIFFCHGGGWNGKSTLLGTIRKILGEYAAEVEPAAFMVDKNRHGGPDEAIASLYKINFCTSTEIEDGQKLSTSLLKRMTGGESLRCERKFEHGFTFRPQYKLWLCGNHEPEISDTTNSIWNRLRKIPFNVIISAQERVKDYDTILAKQHGQAILAWLVEGCLEWQKSGLGESSEVKEATQAYRDAQDVLHDFLAECCLSQPSATCIKSELYKAYEDWCNDGGDKYPLGKKTFNARITEKGFGSNRGGHNKPIWRGLRLLTAEEKEKGNVTNVTNVTDFTQSILYEKNEEKDIEKTVTKVDKVTSSDVKAPKRLEKLGGKCPVCGQEDTEAIWTDDSPEGFYYYCTNCYLQISKEAN